MADTYKTIVKETTSFLKEKGSKFYGYSFIVRSEEDIQECMEGVKKEHHSARHHCYAYRLGVEGQLFRSSDDGEPSHSAGDPILRQIDRHGLTFTLVIVVRYFGGTKLGVGGLIQAYGGAAEEVLKLSRIREVDVESRVTIDFAYAQMSEVMRVLKSFDLSMDSHEFNITCTLDVLVPLRIASEFLENMTQIPFIKVTTQD